MKNLAHRQDSIYLNEHSVDCALLAAGCSLEAVAAVVNGTAEAAAAIIRPPGHHATCCGMMGFCFLTASKRGRRVPVLSVLYAY
mmetsp:Transcript_6121/g.25648  ORF Transcript_6121/g.25648 Transcript_6121/m.25648 type:complete len:84 (-) Transcript_6121:1316-1567(-)